VAIGGNAALLNQASEDAH